MPPSTPRSTPWRAGRRSRACPRFPSNARGIPTSTPNSRPRWPGFDESAFEVGNPKRLPREERAGGMAPQGGRGQETRARAPDRARSSASEARASSSTSGPRAKGVLPVDQFADKLPSPGDMIEVRSRPLRHRRGHPARLAERRRGRGELGEPPQGPDRRGQGHQDQQGGPRRRGRRHPGLPADRADRHQPGRGRRDLRQPEVPGRRHRGQPAREEPGRLPSRPPGAGAGREARGDLEDPRRRPDPQGSGPLDQGLRRLRRDRRGRRPDPRRRHGLVPGLRPVEPAQARRRGRGQGPQDRPGHPEGRPRPEAASCPARGISSRTSITGASPSPRR